MSKTFLEKMLVSQDDKRLYQQERAILAVTERIWEVMQEQAVSKAELAKRLDKSRAYITQLLDGRANMTVRTIADVFFALGKSVEVSCYDLTEGFREWTPTLEREWHGRDFTDFWSRKSTMPEPGGPIVSPVAA